MNYGSLGFINEAYELSIKQDILNALCLGNGSKLYGLYYPCPPKSVNQNYEHATLKHDFMLTPIHYRLWPVSARLHIHMLRKRKTIDEICEYFEEKKISIIHAESSRSAHKYSTWNMHIAFEELLSLTTLNYIEDKHYYSETAMAIQAFVEKMKIDLAHLLWSPDYFEPAEGSANSPLAYFANYTSNKRKISWIDEPWLADNFELTLENTWKDQKLVGDTRFNEILKYLNSKEAGLVPANTFSELQTRSLNIRTVLMPAKDSKRFFYMGMEYERLGGKDTCVGIIKNITSELPDKYNIWHSYNYTINSSPNYDQGNLVFLIEDTSNIQEKHDDKEKESYVNEALKKITGIIRDYNKDNEQVQYKHPNVIGMPNSNGIKRLLELNLDDSLHKEYKYDVFISYSFKDKVIVDKLYNILKYEYNLNPHVSEIKFGQKISETLLRNILDSREMCVIVSKNSRSSEWVQTEWGAAWILAKPLTPIVLNKHIRIPERLKSNLGLIEPTDENLREYAQYLVDSRNSSEANRFRYYYSK